MFNYFISNGLCGGNPTGFQNLSGLETNELYFYRVCCVFVRIVAKAT